MPRLKNIYREEIVPRLMERFGYPNVMLVPKIEKIVVNVGSGTLHQDPKLAESIQEELKLITGQKPVFTRARKAISNFKIRKGMVVGCMVTLRGDRMYEFLDRLISIAIPRIRDFRGFSDRSFDGHGNYTFGIKEQIVFHEIDYDKVVRIHGMDITISTTAPTDEEALELLRAFGFPFRRE
ncbi:MAG: 50S ribosomal protein L5 [bacterium]